MRGSLAVDYINGLLPHFDHHDMSYVAVSRAPIEEIEVVRKRMGWSFVGYRHINPTSTMTSMCHFGQTR